MRISFAILVYVTHLSFLDCPYSKKIRQIRKGHHLLQRELGEMLGVTRRAVERWEHCKNKVSRETWEQLGMLGLL